MRHRSPGHGKRPVLQILAMSCTMFLAAVSVQHLCQKELPAHSKEYLDAGKTDKAHAALRSGSEILAGTCVDILENPELLQKIKEEFQERKKKRAIMK